MQIEALSFSRIEPTAELSGALGIVLVPDAATVKRSYQIAAELLPPDSEYVLNEHSLPHLTLYHGILKALPQAVVQECLLSLRSQLVGRDFELGPLTCFGGNFVYWNVVEISPELRKAHWQVLELCRYLDRSIEPKSSSEEGLTLSPSEQANLTQYGHPLVGELFTPHITLGFHRGVAKTLMAKQTRAWRCTVSAVELVRVGYPGRVDSVFAL